MTLFHSFAKKKTSLLIFMLMIKHYFLPFFSKQEKINLGQEVWNELDAKLPKAYGIIKDDRPRMQEFAKALKSLGPLKKMALQAWLEKQIYELKHNFCELSSSAIEEIERTWLQIYSEHLRVLKSKTP